MLTLAILGAGMFGCVVAISWQWQFSTGLLRRPIENARQQLTAKGFAVTYGMMSVKRDLMIALDAKQRVALCEFGRRGVVVWWRETLAGRTPDRPYPVASQSVKLLLDENLSPAAAVALIADGVDAYHLRFAASSARLRLL